MNSIEMDQLRELARLYRLEISFYDGLGTLRQSPPESILAVLQSLGAPVDSFTDVPDALRQYKSNLKEHFVEPVTVVWQAQQTFVDIQVPEGIPVRFHLTLESGEKEELDLEPGRRQRLTDEQMERSLFSLPADLPCGYHRLEAETDGQRASTLLITSPRLAASSSANDRLWGVFLPLYSLSSRKNWGAGDFTELANLAKWVASLGGDFVGTLPLFSSFLKAPLDPSPYAPVSRLFWNEFFIDPRQTPEWRLCIRARNFYSSSTIQEVLRQNRNSLHVDYAAQMHLKRQVLEALAQEFYARGGQHLPEFREFVAKEPSVEDYATFRAVQEKMCQPWGQWPGRMREGLLDEGDFCADVKRYHVYVQWVAHRQMNTIQALSREKGVGLYLDLPLGAHPDGYDVWRNQTVFVPRVAGGAPPDGFFTNGQDWGFRPLHPERSRAQEHSYFRNVLRRLMDHSQLLRVDHVMSLHRLYWVPAGFSAKDGVYVHYPWEELYASLILESHRQGCVVVGEDLGTVPPSVRESMDNHDIHRMYVCIFETAPSAVPPIKDPPQKALACLNTHDTATFAGFWNGFDIEERRRMKLINDEEYEKERSQRASLIESLLAYFGIENNRSSTDAQMAVLRGLLGHLSRSDAKYLLVNLEDLWLENVPQNMPGTGSERPNWRRKTRLGFEDFSVAPQLLQILREIDMLRKGTENDD